MIQDRRRLVGFFPTRTKVVFQKGGQWLERNISLGVLGPPLPLEIASKIVRDHSSNILIFEDQDAIDTFIGDDHRRCSYRKFVILSQALKSGTVLTLDDVEAQARESFSYYFPHHYMSNRIESVLQGAAAGHPAEVPASSLFFTKSVARGVWCMQALIDNGPETYRFARAAEHEKALIAVYRGQPQSVIKPVYDTEKNLILRGGVAARLLADQYFMVLDPKPRGAVRLAAKRQGVPKEGSEVGPDNGALALYPVSLYDYPIEGCCLEPKVSCRRSVPLDVLASVC